jgi:methionyl aminopeptidase
MNVLLKTEEDIKILKEAGRRLSRILSEIKKAVKPGVSAKFLDDLAFKLAKEKGDTPAFLCYKADKSSKPYPSSLCVSINDEIVHGLPISEKVLKEGDIVGIDMGLIHKGLVVDSAFTSGVGKIDEVAKKLLKKTQQCLEAGIREAKAGNTLGDIGWAIESTCPKEFSIAEDLAGHGVGYKLHEDPYVLNQGKRGEGLKLEPGMVLALEPMLCEGKGVITFDKDSFTVRTKDGKRSAHFEHTVAITEREPEVLTQ